MSVLPRFDPLLLLLDDPAALAALLAGEDPALAPAVAGQPIVAPAAPGPVAPPEAAAVMPPEPAAVTPPAAAEPAPPLAGWMMPEDAFPTIEELDAALADSYLPEPGLDRALRIELAEAFGIDHALIDDDAAFMAALAGLEPPPEDDYPEPLPGELAWDPSWIEAGREDWALG